MPSDLVPAAGAAATTRTEGTAAAHPSPTITRSDSPPVAPGESERSAELTPLQATQHSTDLRTEAWPLIRGLLEVRASAPPDAPVGVVAERRQAPAGIPSPLAALALMHLFTWVTSLTGRPVGAPAHIGSVLFLQGIARYGGQLQQVASRTLGQLRDSVANAWPTAAAGEGQDLRRMLPPELWREIFDLLPPRSLHAVSKVDQWWGSAVKTYYAQKGSVPLLEQRALDQLARHSGTSVRMPSLQRVVLQAGLAALQVQVGLASLRLHEHVPATVRSAEPQGRLSEIVQLLGCPPADPGRGGSSVLGLPPQAREPALAVLTALAGQTRADYWLMVCVNALRADPSQPVADAIRTIADRPPAFTLPQTRPDGTITDRPASRMHVLMSGTGIANTEELQALCAPPAEAASAFEPLAVVFCEMATRVTTPRDLQSLVGRPMDADGYGGIGILSLPTHLQVYPLRVLNHHLFPGEHISHLAFHPDVLSLVAQATASTGDPRALRSLCASGLCARGIMSVDSLRSVWSAVCTPPDFAHASSMKALLPAVSRFPLHERTERFEQNLSAWETLADEDPSRLRMAFEYTASISAQRIPRADEALTQTLHASVPEAFHEEGERRIRALREKVNA